MKTLPRSRLAAALSLAACLSILALAGWTARAQDAAAPATPVEPPWPRKFTSDGLTIVIYQPQIERWQANQLQARAAVSVQNQAAAQPTFGTIWLAARTEVDKETRLVTLEDLALTKANFPTAAGQTDAYLAAIRKQAPQRMQTIALDRLQASLAIAQDLSQTQKLPLKNEPPRVLVSSKPAVLILIDGQPALRQTTDVNTLRIINTRFLILLDQISGKYFLRLSDHWLTAAGIQGPWTVAPSWPSALDTIMNSLTTDGQVTTMDDPPPDLKDELENGVVPVIYVSTGPAELIQTQGAPQFTPIDGTQLLYVKNTTSQILLDLNTQSYYVLLSGRWFRSKSLDQGPWEFVPADQVPADFAKIPEAHPKGAVLASVAGTPQAKEAVIANTVPQTATIRRKEAKIEPLYDGDPQFQPVEGTSLSYAVNSPTPVIQVSPTTYYAVENGVWFTAPAPAGPWTVAASVPQVIYTIPPSSPISYVTGVQVYGATPEYVYVGYTPTYYGTFVSPWNTVVYGSGWAFTPWIGRYWFGRPWTYGFGVAFGWGPGGWGFGFAGGFCHPWWGPVGWHGWWGGAAWRNGWEHGWGGHYVNYHPTNINFNHFNAYNRWNNNVHVNSIHNNRFDPINVNNRIGETNIGNRVGNETRIGDRTNIGSGNIGNRINIGNLGAGNRQLNNIYSDHLGNTYRRNNDGWDHFTNEGWKPFSEGNFTADRRGEFQNIDRGLNREFQARNYGNLDYDRFRNYGGFGGNGGFRSYGGFDRFGGGGFRGFRGGRR